MKKIFVPLLLCFFSLQLMAQVIKSNNQFAGFGKFILGKTTAQFGDNIIFNTKYTRDNHEFKVYSYSIVPGEPVELMNIPFNSILMTFNDNNKLVLFSFIKFYKKNGSPKFAKEAKHDVENLRDYISKELNDEGERKTISRTNKSSESSQEWDGAKGLLKIIEKYAGDQTVIEISFSSGDQ